MEEKTIDVIIPTYKPGKEFQVDETKESIQ